VASATEMGIPVCFTPGGNHTTVAEHCFGLLWGMVKNRVAECHNGSAGKWKRLIGHERYGKTIGIVGLGRNGKEVDWRARAFGLEVIAYDIYWDADFAETHNVRRANTMEDIWAEADIISLHTNLSEETRDMINLQTLSKMKDGVLIINCARGELVNVDA